jgi:pimeloyl-ACP methyl ester carboxylesterase
MSVFERTLPIRPGMAALVAMLTGLLSVTVVMAPAQAAPSASHPVRTTIHWSPCEAGFLCASARVPLDYDHPTGTQISLALTKLPATDPAHRIGSLFINPGGPGGSGVDFVQGVGSFLLTNEVRARFDLIGFDPRGIARSTPLTCFATQQEALNVLPPFPYPTNASETKIWITDNNKLDAACARNGGAMLNHMSTANVARDLDVLRAAVGDAGLNYYGLSYGSFLGNMYANLFPGRVRSVVIDGVLDPISWTTGRGDQGREVPFSTRLRSAVGAQATLKEFFRLCDAGGANCPFAPHAARRYATLLHELKENPLPITFPDGTSLNYDESFLIADTLGAMYDSASWPDLATILVDLEKRVAARELAAGLSRLSRQGQQLQPLPYDNFVEAGPAVFCSDSINPTDYSAWTRAASSSARTDGLFGPLWTWISSNCAKWPGHDADRYLGPFNHRTKNPVLVVGNIFDPATPYQGATTTAKLLPNSRLLTVHGWGHTSLFRSSCATSAIGRYLVTSRPPPRGTICEQDVVPFAAPMAAARARSTAVTVGGSILAPRQLAW